MELSAQLQPIGEMVSPSKTTVKRAWWKECSVYQIYPSSFKDSNGDGVGDLPGIIEQLDYIKALNVDIVWLCPIYESPRVDMGYDIAAYDKIDPRYGTLEDVEQLIAGLHDRGMKFLMDLVVNHTSDQHDWFQQSRMSRNNPYRDWYIWRKPKYDAQGQRCPPNNWSSYFGGSAWEYDELTGEYYLHLFAVEQPDLNWEVPQVRKAVHDIMRFWLDKGVDGFRMDVINLISKVPGLPDATVKDTSKQYHHGSEHYANGPRLHEFLQDIGSILEEYDAFSVGEMPWISDPDEILRGVGFERKELQMIFNFDIVDMDHGPGGKFTPKQWQMSDLKAIVGKWQTFMYENDGWNALYLENHDQSRTVSRWASDEPKYRDLSAKLFATFLGFQSGTPFIYQGQELGMSNIPSDWSMDEFRDLETLNHWHELQKSQPKDTALQTLTKSQYHLKSRDNARTPMQWDATAHAGFTTGHPWFRVHDSYPTCNAQAQVGVPSSPFEHWAQVLRLRKQMPDLFVYGRFEMVDAAHEDVFAYRRMFEGEGRGRQEAIVVCNFRRWDVVWAVPEGVRVRNRGLLLSSYGKLQRRGDGLVVLRPFEAFVCLLDEPKGRL